jgi:hypothetical protein
MYPCAVDRFECKVHQALVHFIRTHLSSIIAVSTALKYSVKVPLCTYLVTKPIAFAIFVSNRCKV